MITRLAPTPSGYLHLGNILNFVLTWLTTKKLGGTLHLRIDDLDKDRVREKYIDDIFFTLDWLGLDYDHGPSGTEDFLKHYSQTLRLDRYSELLRQVQDRSETFNCQCSRKSIQQNSPNGLYPGTCLTLGLGSLKGQAATRLDTRRADEIQIKEQKYQGDRSLHRLIPYPVLLKKDGIPSYQIASLADDLAMKVNYLIRGEDLWSSSLLQVELSKLISQNEFMKATFLHHPLVTVAGQKLSKSQGHSQTLRETYSKKELLYLVGESLGLKAGFDGLEGFLEEFHV